MALWTDTSAARPLQEDCVRLAGGRPVGEAKGRVWVTAPVLEQAESRFQSASSLTLTTACVHAACRPASCARARSPLSRVLQRV